MLPDRQVPCVGPDILAGGAALQIQESGAVEQKHIAGAMPQAAPMHFTARNEPQRAPCVVEGLEQFLGGYSVC